MDTKDPIYHYWKEISYVFFICDAFTLYVITKLTPQNDAETVAYVLLKN